MQVVEQEELNQEVVMVVLDLAAVELLEVLVKLELQTLEVAEVEAQVMFKLQVVEVVQGLLLLDTNSSS
jgi:PIN domain nuclease of toxin-antitoxin system|tara:strand:- start:54 stop:260 length:207 start_codon:yes stop_codon:yes gene_type:complete